MVDAAVGGKTGVNTAAGKNLVGAFHPPAGVLCDLTTLDTLPRRRPRRRAGRGGQVRLHRRPGDPRPGRGRPGGGGRPDRPGAARAGRAGDPGQGRRGRPATCASPACARSSTTATRWATRSRSVEGYRWRHGHAVAVGLVFAAELARRAGRLDDADRGPAPARAATCSGCRPPTGRTPGPSCCAAMRVDKKARGDRCASWCWTASAGPASWTVRTTTLLERGRTRRWRA